jgi:dihydroneopterin aldolase/2-amino-4-hydroxy-6-hydroxymethyldihydropteridine diphosphokinase
MDRVSVTGITGFGYHGVFADEKRDGQEFSCDVTLHLDTRRAAARDDLTETVHYGLVAEAVHAVLTGPPHDLLETVAARIAATILADPMVGAVDVVVHKPQAPITVPFRDVTMSVHRTRADVVIETDPASPVDAVLALGSNVGDREAHLRGAVVSLAGSPGIEVVAVSPVVETDPVGGPGGQGAFLNAVVLVRTRLSALSLLHVCQDVESAHGRIREVRWGPRTLDVDVLVHGDHVVATEPLTLPHPRLAERPFVLVPWHLVDADAVVPGLLGERAVADLVAPFRVGADGGDVPGVTVRPDIDITAPGRGGPA